MSPLDQHLSDYLTMRRALGHRLERSEKLLWQFVSYLDGVDAVTITTHDALDWAMLPSRSRAWSAIRLSAVRGFAGYLHTLDECCEVPPSDVLRPRPRLAVPYLYSPEQLQALLSATDTLSCPLRAATFQTLIGLLAATGMRIGEAIAADHDKARQLPLHPSTTAAIRAYLKRPDRPARPQSPALLLSIAGTRLRYPNVLRTFVTLLGRAGVTARSERCRPRIHDLRHTFAVQTLLDCYRTGVDIDRRLPLLSTYLGHVNPASTYWYLTGSPELLALAGQRLQTSLGES